MKKYLLTELRFGGRRHLRDHMNGVLCGRYSPTNGSFWKDPKVAALMVSCKDCRRELLRRHPELR